MSVLVVVPSLNEEDNIKACLMSVRSQKTDCELKVVLCDGGSGDKTVEIAKEYVDTVVLSDRKSVAIQRNIGAHASDGDMILFLDADTVLPPGYILWGVRKFRENPSLLGFSAGFTFTERDKKFVFAGRLTNEYLKFRDRIGSPTLPGFNIFVTRKAFNMVGGFQDVQLEDIDFSRRLNEQGETRYFTEMSVITSSRRLAMMGLIGTLKYYFEMDVARKKPDLKKYLVYSEYVSCRQPALHYKKLFDRLYSNGIKNGITRKGYDAILTEIKKYLID